MRGYALASAPLGGLFLGLALALSGVAFRGLDVLIALAYAAGAAVSVYAYARGQAQGERRLAVIGMALNVAALLLHLAAAL